MQRAWSLSGYIGQKIFLGQCKFDNGKKNLFGHTRFDNVLSHWFREDESRIYLCPVFLIRTATKTSEPYSRQNSAAFLKRPLLCSCTFVQVASECCFFTHEDFFGHHIGFWWDEIYFVITHFKMLSLLNIIFYVMRIAVVVSNWIGFSSPAKTFLFHRMGMSLEWFMVVVMDGGWQVWQSCSLLVDYLTKF